MIHGDITDDNVVCSTLETGRMPDGIIDFGDLTRSWTVSELAVAGVVGAAPRGRLSRRPRCPPSPRSTPCGRWVRPRSRRCGRWLCCAPRCWWSAASTSPRIDADNDYATGALDNEWRIFERATEVPLEVMTAQIRHALRRRASRSIPSRRDTPLIAGLDPRISVRLDLSVESDAMDGGMWLDPAAKSAWRRRAIGAGAAAVVTVFGQPRAHPIDDVEPGGTRDRRHRRRPVAGHAVDPHRTLAGP